MDFLKARLRRLLLWSQKYTRTDMVYLARGGFWVMLNSVVAALVSVVLAVAFANLLSKETYGTYRYVLAIASAFGFLALTGMNASVTRSVARGHDGALPYAVRAQLRWNLLYTATLTLVGAYYLARHSAVTLGVSLLILGVLLPPSWAYATYSAYIVGKKDFKRGMQYSLIGSLIYLASMLAAIVFGGTALWLVFAYAASTCAVYALLYAMTVAKYRPVAIEDRERAEMESFGKRLSLINVVSVIAQQVDNIVIYKFIGPAELAVYAFANLMPERLKQFAKTGLGILVPKLAEKDLRDVVKSLRLRFAQSLLVGALAALAYAAVAPTVFTLLFPQYVTSIRYSQLIGASLAFAVPMTYVAYAFQSHKLLREIYTSSVVTNLLRIALIVGGAWYGGALGVIFGKLVGNAFGAVFSYFLLERSIRRRPVASEVPVD